MKKTISFFLFLSVLFLAPALHALQAGEVPAREKPAIYDPAADVKALITAAMADAAAGQKNILLMFGGNWCPWCHFLHELFDSDRAIQDRLQKSFILIMVDVGEKAGQPLNTDLLELYRVKGMGYPSLAVLDAKGKLLAAQSSGVLEKGRGHDPKKVLAFLDIHAPGE
ncbi:MAG: thioredoxin family protein [Acidobacteriota bacterium]|nr:thioredoxin family protein [Acidobacteriota bacterium]